MRYYDYCDDSMEIRDTMYGTVTGSNGNGVYLILENDEPAFAYFGKLKIGTRVLCTVKKPASGSYSALVCIDSNPGEELMCA